MNNKICKVGLLGLGNMGQNHLRNLVMLKQVEVSFIYDLDEEICNKTYERYGIKVSTDLEEDLKHVDGVIIVTPTFTHAKFIRQVSKYVKNIFVEKPLTDTLESSNEIMDLIKELKLNIQVGFIERYNSAVVTLAKTLKNSHNVINIDFTRTNKVSNRITDVDVIIDLMVHDIDLAVHLNGNIKKINAHGYIHNNVIEYARAILTHTNGTFSNIVASRITEKRIRHISATCDDMYIDCNLLSKEIFVTKQTIEQYLNDVSITSKSETINVRLEESLLLELIDFIKMCNGENIQVPNENDGLLAIEIAERIRKQIMDTNNEN